MTTSAASNGPWGAIAEPDPAAARRAVRDLVARDALRDRIAAVVRRRVPTSEAEDLVQSILCEVLAAERAPLDPADLSRWIGAITRNEIADFHRRAKHRRTATLPEVAVSPAPFEARALLDGVRRSAALDARARQTLEWVVREHEGEPLEEIAREAEIPSAQVRKRVSRFRQAMRRTWLVEAAAIAVVASSLLGAVAAIWIADDRFAVVAEPSASGPAADEALAALQGEWRVATAKLDPSVDERLRALVEAEGPSLRVRVEGRRLVITTRALDISRTLDVRPTSGGRFSLIVRDGKGGGHEAEGEIDGEGRVILRSAAGRFRGVVTLGR